MALGVCGVRAEFVAAQSRIKPRSVEAAKTMSII
jgi:hypothetical protein